MPDPRELPKINHRPRAKAIMQKPQGGARFLVQIPWGVRGRMVMEKIDSCITTTTTANFESKQGK